MQFPRVRTNNLEQTSIGFCEAQTLGNSLKVGLRVGYLSVRTAGGAYDGH